METIRKLGESSKSEVRSWWSEVSSVTGHLLAAICILLSVFSLLSSVSYGAGLQTNFGFVMVENLQPGMTYNIRELSGLPLDVFNTGSERVQIQMEIQQPTTAQETGMVNAGFEPIPDIKWVKLSQDSFEIQPGQKALADIIIKIPDDDKLLGKKIQVNIWSHMIGVKFLAAGLRSKLRFTIADRRFTPEQLKDWDKTMQSLKDVNFSLLPFKAELEKFPLGRKVDINKQYKVTLKLVNPSDESFRYQIKSISVKQSKMGLYPDFEDTPDPNFMTFSENEFTIEPESIKKVNMYINIPKKDEYKGKNFMFIVAAQVLNQPVAFEIYSRILISTEK